MSLGAVAGGRRPRFAAGAVVILALALVPARPAGADPARPTNFRSTVLSVRPALPAGASVRVVGGDAFLELHIPRGHTAVVADYPTVKQQPPPYLRFDADGTVERNERSVASVANASRYGHSSRTPHPDEAPVWKTVGHGGTYVWHDHRIHWMLSIRPDARSLLAGGRVPMGGPGGTWSVPLVVDGHAVTVIGELRIFRAPSPAPWYGLMGMVVVAAVSLGAASRMRRRPVPYRPVAVGAAATCVLAAVVGWAAWRSIPAAAGANPLVFVVPLVGLAEAIVALVCAGRVRLIGLVATAAVLLGWGWLRVDVLDHAELPTDLAFAIDRAATAMALGTGLALAALVLWQPPALGRTVVSAGDGAPAARSTAPGEPSSTSAEA